MQDMRHQLKDTKICVTCTHEASVCTCKPENQKLVRYADYIENKYHANHTGIHVSDCYAKI